MKAVPSPGNENNAPELSKEDLLLELNQLEEQYLQMGLAMNVLKSKILLHYPNSSKAQNPIMEVNQRNAKRFRPDVDDDYSEKPLSEKVMFLLKINENEAKSGSELLADIIAIEPGRFGDTLQKKKLSTNLFTTLNNKVKSGELFRELTEDDQYIYSTQPIKKNENTKYA